MGTRGFNQPAIVDRWHKRFGHSQYLERAFCQKYWLPFFSKGIIVESEEVASRPSFWMRLLAFVANKYFLVGLAMIPFLLWPLIWIEDRTPSANQVGCTDIRTSTPTDWRAANLKADQPGAFYVIVSSVTDFREYPLLNELAARAEGVPTLSSIPHPKLRHNAHNKRYGGKQNAGHRACSGRCRQGKGLRNSKAGRRMWNCS